MDITNNISSDLSGKEQNGGMGEYLSDLIESSDYDVNLTDTELVGGASTISDNEIADILIGSDINLDIKNFDINDLNKNQAFSKLSNNQKTLVINRILEKIPKKTNRAESIVNKDSYFYCKSCGYNEKIPPKQFIFSRGDEKKDDTNGLRFINNKFDPILPYSKKYNCINSNCQTHSKPELKMAVFYRQTGSYNVKYICTICDSYWNTFIEK
jgi:hypothetical protein